MLNVLSLMLKCKPQTYLFVRDVYFSPLELDLCNFIQQLFYKNQ